MVHGERGNKADIISLACPVSASPCHQLGHVVISDLGQQFVLAKIVQQHPDQRPGVGCARQMLCVLSPVARCNVLQAQRGLGLLDLRDDGFGPIALGVLYLLHFPLDGGLVDP